MFRVALCLLALVFVSVSARSQTLIRVYVQAGSGDFASNNAGDSAQDVRKAILSKSKMLSVVDDPSQADIVVQIDSRDVRKETVSMNTYKNKSDDGKST